MMVELSDCGGEIDQTAEGDPAGTTLAAACLWGGAAAVLMCRGLCPERLGLWWVPPASQRLLGCLTGHTPAALDIASGQVSLPGGPTSRKSSRL